MSMRLAARIARRDLRGGLQGFRVFLICLALGVAAIAAIGTVRDSITAALQRDGAALLGGDAEIQLTYRRADQAELDWLNSTFDAVSEIIDFRSMVVVDGTDGTDRALTQVKAVDSAYPLYGTVALEPDIGLDTALRGTSERPGAVIHPVLADRLGLKPGAVFRLGAQEFSLSAVLVVEPDAAGSGFSLGPRTIVRTQDLAQSGLLQPGTLYESAYRVTLQNDQDLDALKKRADDIFNNGGFRWRDRRNAAPGVSDFVAHVATFLVLVGLAGLAVGGVGVSAAVRTYLDEKTTVIATLKSMGAPRNLIFQIYAIQIGILSIIGVILGLAAGVALPMALAPVLEARLPIPIDVAIQWGSLAQAGVYGLLAALLFSIWPLSRTDHIQPAALFRDANLGGVGWPRFRYFIIILVALGLLIYTATSWSGEVWLTLWMSAGIVAAFATLTLAAVAMKILSRKMASLSGLRGRTSLRMALASVGGPGGEVISVVVSLGLGLSVLAAIAQIDQNLRSAISRDLPDMAPSYFVVDIQSDQLNDFKSMIQDRQGVDRLQAAPMLRGVITRINGRPAAETAGDHWVTDGDRGITFSANLPAGINLTSGSWWPADYTGDPQISFSAEEATEIGLALGDTMTVDVLGRPITATITSFREVDFSSAGMGFVLSMNPAAISSAPHTYIATIYAEQSVEARILRDISTRFPNITAISVRDAIERLAGVLRGISSAVSYGAAATVLTGIVVLIGAAMAGERSRTYEAAVLKTIGARRSSILANFAWRFAFVGLAAGVIAVVTGGISGWAVMTYVMENEFEFDLMSALMIVGGGIAATTLAGLLLSLRSLNARPAQILRSRE